jgi:hypothetical protein
VKLFAPATGAAVVLLAPLVATAGGAEDDGAVVWDSAAPALIAPRRRAVTKILFI